MSPKRHEDKTRRYLELVDARKDCDACRDPANPSKDLINPSECESGIFDAYEIGPWSRWQGNLDAELMLVAQDWGDIGWFVCEQGRPTNTSTTNTTLIRLLAAAGIDVSCRAIHTAEEHCSSRMQYYA